ncbi:glycosyltransferase [Roseixanthobacter liquoris]|uniref:glycosyltransferase n=1 Tax=Roseixanthobacter liquoris TaxID=3119921 RepID=UPI0037264FE5
MNSTGSRSAPPLRVLPAPRGTRDGGAAIWVLYEALERLGIAVVDGAAQADRKDVDICHMHWPEYAMGADRPWRRMADAGRFFGKLAWMKMHGARLIWTAHNVYPHDTSPRRSMELFYFILFSMLDGLIFLNEASRDLFYRRHPRCRSAASAVIPAANVRSIFADVAETGTREPDGHQFLFFGVIRPYKGLDRLMTAFSALAAPRTRLVCAGAAFANPDYMSWIAQLAAADERIDLRIGWVPEREIAALFGASAVVVLPYRDLLNSGVAILALSLDRPVLLPSTPSSLELRNDIGREWVMTYEGELTPQLLSESLAWATQARPGSPDLSAFDPDAVARRTLDFYLRVRGRAAKHIGRTRG